MEFNLHIPVSNFEFIDNNDSHFLKVRLQAIANGENLNRSSFDKDGMELSKDTFRGKPLLCAFPKNKYTGGYKLGDGHNSSGIMYDSEYDEFYRSYLDPNSERMVGYIPFDSNIDIELIEGKYWMCMDAVILRRYNYELVKDILNKKKGTDKRNNKRISVEIEVLESHLSEHETEGYEVEVIDKFKGMGVTILFDETQEAVVGANLKAFSESKQYDRFKSFMQCNFDAKNFIDKDDIGSGEKISIKRDKVSDTPWGDVDKSDLYKKAMSASNYKAVVKFIYAKVEDGWMDNPSEKLKYPIGQISDGEAFYNKGALSSALGYSKSSGDDAVTEKVEKIRKKLGIDDQSESYAVEKSVDMIDGKIISSEYPDNLEMEEKDNVELFNLTANQKKEVLEIAVSNAFRSEHEDDDDDENRHYSYWLCDYDDEYVYIQDYCMDCRTFRIKYAILEDGTAEVYMDTKEEVIRGGYEVVGKGGNDTMEEDFNKEDITEEKDMAEGDSTCDESDKEDMSFEDQSTEEDFESEESTSFDVEYSSDFSVICDEAEKIFLCKVGNYAIYSDGNELFASNECRFDEKTSVSIELKFDSQTISVGGVNESEPQNLAPIRVAFASQVANMLSDAKNIKKDFEAEVKKSEAIQKKLEVYRCKELSSKFEEISEGSNITLSEKTDWKNRINSNEFSNEDELIEKFGGFVFKKNIENKNSAYSTEIITEKVNNKKSYEELIDQYMTDK